LLCELNFNKIYKMSGQNTHKADATALLDERGYSGPLVRGQNPAHLFEKAVRDRVTNSLYWMEQCYGLNAETLCDRAVRLDCIGGTYGGAGKPTPFLCLAFKLLQLLPDKEIILEYLNFGADEQKEKDEDEEEDVENSGETNGRVGDEKDKGHFKYLRALAAFYIRLTWEPTEIYKTLEPLLGDYRKLRRRVRDGFVLTYVDQFIDDLLTKERVCATSLWKLPGRSMLEDLDLLEPRESPLGEELEELDQDDGSDRDEDMSEGQSEASFQSESSAAAS
jgi:pre-mRNA-splicing factor 38A